jgi:HEAT repeats
MAGTVATIANAPVRKPSKFEQQLSALHGSPSADEVGAALRSKNGLLIAAAAAHADSLALAAAFTTLLDEPVKRDPVCRGKIAIARALHDRDDWSEIFVAGLHHVQKESGVDTAAELRGICGIAHAHSRRPDVLDVLADLLADPEPVARIAAAQALGDAGRPDAAALLRFKLRIGDDHGDVIGASCESLLAVQGEAALPFVSELLVPPYDDVVALALAQSRLSGAVPLVRGWVDRAMPDVRRSIGYLALALTRAAHDDLLEVVRTGNDADALAAAKALATFREDPAIRDRLLAAAPRALRDPIAALLA